MSFGLGGRQGSGNKNVTQFPRATCFAETRVVLRRKTKPTGQPAERSFGLHSFVVGESYVRMFFPLANGCVVTARASLMSVLERDNRIPDATEAVVGSLPQCLARVVYASPCVLLV